MTGRGDVREAVKRERLDRARQGVIPPITL